MIPIGEKAKIKLVVVIIRESYPVILIHMKNGNEVFLITFSYMSQNGEHMITFNEGINFSECSVDENNVGTLRNAGNIRRSSKHK